MTQQDVYDWLIIKTGRDNQSIGKVINGELVFPDFRMPTPEVKAKIMEFDWQIELWKKLEETFLEENKRNGFKESR